MAVLYFRIVRQSLLLTVYFLQVGINMFRLFFAFICALLFIYLYTNKFAPVFVFWFYLLMSSVTFGVYVVDKLAARNNRWRVKETTLHYLALFGGWFGALLAQRFINHKSTKKSFLTVFCITVCLNILLLLLLLNSEIILANIINKLNSAELTI